MIIQQTVACQPHWIGVDVSKETLSIYFAKEAKNTVIANRPRAISGFLRKNSKAFLVLEATGGYEAELVAKALEIGHTVYRVNPRRVRAFMESRGIFAKTDAVDAKALAEYAMAFAQELRPFALPDPRLKELRQLVRRRDQLVLLRVLENNRLQAPDNVCLQRSIKTVLKCLESQIEAIEQLICQHVRSAAELNQKIKVMTAVKGIGQLTAVNLLVSMPEIGQLGGKQVASLAGLAPFSRDSGKKQGYRRTGGGRTDVRRALYMATLSAIRYNSVIESFYTRLLKNGKRPLQAIIASARKLLVILNAKLRDAALSPGFQQS